MIYIDKDPTLKTLLEQEALKARGLYTGEVDNWPGPKFKTAYAAFMAGMKPSTGIQVTRWKEATIKPGKVPEVAAIVARILKNMSRYEVVADASGVPAFIIACLHNMEASGDFTKHLHEGSPLTGRTKYVPKGRPLKGNPPFAWEESALDALKYDGLGEVNWDSLEDLLDACEAYNGWGYQKFHPETPSPYLWAGTSVERPGKYVSDGVWDPKATSGQIGVACILKQLEKQGEIQLPL